MNELAKSTDPNLYINESVLHRDARYMFAETSLSDAQIGITVGIISLLLLCTALVGLVKTLHSMLGGRLALVVKRVVNAQLPGVLRHFTGYLFIGFAVGCTILIQSSSIFTSTLTPLVGVGIVSLERMYTFTLGSDLGTTLTGLFAALAADADSLNVAMQVACCHLIFNVAGILLFYPLPFMRWPVMLSQWMGDTTARYRWFPIFYIIVLFVVLPGVAILLSLAGTFVMLIVGLPPVIAFGLIVLLNVVQNKWPQVLPVCMRDWHFLPEWMRSLEPYDRAMKRMSCYKKLSKCTTTASNSTAQMVIVNGVAEIYGSHSSKSSPVATTCNSSADNSPPTSNGSGNDGMVSQYYGTTPQRDSKHRENMGNRTDSSTTTIV